MYWQHRKAGIKIAVRDALAFLDPTPKEALAIGVAAGLTGLRTFNLKHFRCFDSLDESAT